MMRNFLVMGLLGIATVATGSGCTMDTANELGSLKAGALRRYASVHNGLDSNGRGINGRSINGRSINGRSINGRSINGLGVNAPAETAPRTLVGVEADTGTVMHGSDFVGAELEGRLDDGGNATVKVYAFDDTTVPGMEFYLVKYKDNGEPICGYKDGAPIWATVMNELFDPDTGDEVNSDGSQFTFGCRFFGVQKCQEYGYPKDKKAKERKSGVDRVRRFNDYHASCIRMVRADYCGDGVPHTYDGTTIDIYDHLLNNNAPATSGDGSDGWHIEAEWDSDGAHCINKTRWMPNTLSGLAGNQSSSNPDWEYIRTHCPQRFAYSVPLVGGGMSTPDRSCGASSNWNTSVGYDLFAADTSAQAGRGKIRNNSQLYQYTP